MHIEDKKNFIRESLANLKANVQLDNSANLTSLAVLLENFICELLNLLHDYELQNKNQKKSNFESLDLYDSNNGYGVQITSREDGTKIYDTIRSLNEGNNHEINKLIFVILGGKKNYKKIPESIYDVEIIDLEDLYKLIINSKKLDKACDLFRRHLNNSSNIKTSGLDYILYRSEITYLATLNVKFLLYYLLITLILTSILYFYNLSFLALLFISPFFLYYELRKRKFYRLGDTNLEIDNLNHLFTVQLAGDCFKCKSQEKNTLRIRRFKKENENAYFKISCLRNEKMHVWDFDYTILGNIEHDILYKEIRS